MDLTPVYSASEALMESDPWKAASVTWSYLETENMSPQVAADSSADSEPDHFEIWTSMDLGLPPVEDLFPCVDDSDAFTTPPDIPRMYDPRLDELVDIVYHRRTTTRAMFSAIARHVKKTDLEDFNFTLFLVPIKEAAELLRMPPTTLAHRTREFVPKWPWRNLEKIRTIFTTLPAEEVSREVSYDMVRLAVSEYVFGQSKSKNALCCLKRIDRLSQRLYRYSIR